MKDCTTKSCFTSVVILTLFAWVGFELVIEAYYDSFLAIGPPKFQRPKTFYETNCSTEADFNASAKLTFVYNPNMGLGNRLFLYASTYGIGEKLRKCPFVRNRPAFPPVHQFHISAPEIGSQTVDIKLKWHEQVCCMFDDSIVKQQRYKNSTGNLILLGYMQSWRYFESHFEILRRREFRFESRVATRCEEIVKDIRLTLRLSQTELRHKNTVETCTFVGVHVRRGDMSYAMYKKMGYKTADSEYLRRAMEYFREKLDSAHEVKCARFLVLGNDPTWNRAQIPRQHDVIQLMPDRDAVVDMCILAKCQHTIITTGTFGWWAAFLADGMATYQADYARPGSKLAKQFIEKDYFLPNWMPL